MKRAREAGAATAGVQRQYLGCAGKVANGINTVHLAYVREHTGHALIGARQWIPREQIEDPARSLVMGLPLDLAFRTKGQLAIDVAAEALAGGVTFDFFCGDEVYGNCTQLRDFFKDRGQGMCCGSRARSASPWPSADINLRGRGQPAAGQRAPAGGPLGREGPKGARWYAWSWLAAASPRHCLLIRRHLKTR